MMALKTQSHVIEELVAASNEGRGIVPLIGAGFSIESGIPALSTLTQYLAKVQHYIGQGLYAPVRKHSGARAGSAGQTPEIFLDNRDYRRDPSLYLQDFGWPDPNQLDSSLWERVAPVPGVAARRLLDHKVEEELIRDIERSDEDLARKIRLLTESREQFLPHAPEPLKLLFETGLWKLKGNWKTLLPYLTRANPDYVDKLFHQLVKHRNPGTSHRFMAFLAPLLGIRLILTTNFDNLLEESLRLEGFHPFVYEVSKDALLPHHSLVQGELSVVKLHGGAFGLRVGESLDHPLDENSRQRLKGYLPRRSVLLVMGLGGWDRRILDLVELVAGHNQDVKGSFVQGSVYWLHFEPECPPPVQSLVQSTKGAVCTARVQDPGAFLVDFYSRLSGNHPPSAHAYSPQILRPIDPRPFKGGAFQDKSIYFILDHNDDLGLGSSLELAHLVAAKAGTHVPIWVDLEAMATVTDAVVEIFRQLRKYDPALSPIILPAGQALDDVADFDKPVRRIFDALKRGRYLLAFSATRSFGRPPTYHHGTLQRAGEGPHPGTRFLIALIRAAIRGTPYDERPLKDSILAFAVNKPSVRDGAPDVGVITSYLENKQEKHPEMVEILKPRPDDHVAERAPIAPELSEALLLIAAFRRRRSAVAMHRLLPKYLQIEPELKGTARWRQIEIFLDELERKRYLLKVEGGSYWMSRRLRDAVYEQHQSATRSAYLKRELEAGEKAEVNWKPLWQLAQLAAIHRDIAEYYHSNMYIPSQDLSALLEHVYHRISSLRYLTKLQAWIQVVQEEPVPSESIATLRRQLGGEIVTPERRLNQDFLRKLRYMRLHAILQVFERERERLLSGISADTLVGWVDWIQKEDIPRFRTDLCLNPSARSGLSNITIFFEKSDEQEIANECAELWNLLEDLKAVVFRDRGDIVQCINLRAGQIRWLVERTPPPAKPRLSIPTGWEWIESSREDVIRFLFSSPPCSDDDRRQVVRFLCDIWACLRGANNLENQRRAEMVRSLVEAIVKPYLNPVRERTGDEEMTVLWFRHAADHEAMSLNPWEFRGTWLKSNHAMEEQCRRITALCEAGLNHIEWSGGKEYRRHQSYFHSLKARALYMLGRYVDAHAELDLSQSGLAANVGANREILGAGLLRLAECLLVRADHAIIDCCRESLTQHSSGSGRSGLDAFSAEGRLCLIWHHVQADWRRTLGTVEDPETRWKLRFAMARWMEFACKEEGRERTPYPSEPYQRIRGELDLGRPRLDDWESKWSVQRVESLLVQETREANWATNLHKVHSLSIACWPEWLWQKESTWPGLAVTIRRSEELLMRAGEVLERAEIMLAEARRNVEWWACLYQLRAQLHTELLLLQITHLWSPDCGEAKPRFIARFVSNLEAGLRAVRQGLDVVQPVRALGVNSRNGQLAGSLRVSRFVRIWIQLMVCGAYLTRETARMPGEPRISWDRLWRQWASMCKSAGFQRLLYSEKFFELYDQAVEPSHGYTGNPGGRAFVLASVRGCIRAGGRRVLLDNLALARKVRGSDRVARFGSQ
jgi:hypothetical protein